MWEICIVAEYNAKQFFLAGTEALNLTRALLGVAQLPLHRSQSKRSS